MSFGSLGLKWNHRKLRLSPGEAFTKLGATFPPLVLQIMFVLERSRTGSFVAGDLIYLPLPSPWSLPLTKAPNMVAWADAVLAKAKARAAAVNNMVTGGNLSKDIMSVKKGRSTCTLKNEFE